MEVVRTICQMCDTGGCGIKVWREKGEIVKVEGDPDNPLSLSGLCAKGMAAVQLEYTDRRILHPLRRKGERGEGQWERISLDEAISITAHELGEIKEKYGPQSIAYYRGAASGWDTNFQYVCRFMNVLGSPNIVTHSNNCSVPRRIGAMSVLGDRTSPDFEHANLIILWGFNPAANFISWARRILDAKERGAKLVVIDSRFSESASKADIFVQPRPGTDGALALGMVHVIMNEKLYDEDFIHKWTVGFSELEGLVKRYSPKTVEEITGVPSEDIVAIARIYGTTRPACLQDGNGLDMHTNVVQTARSLAMLRALTGNVGAVGGDVFIPEVGFADVTLREKLPRGVRPVTKHPLFFDVWFDTTPEVQDAIFSEEPYPIKGMIVQGGCPVLATPDSSRTKEALKRLNFLVVHELFLTATAELADIVIPAVTFLERDYLFKYRNIRTPDVHTNLFGLQRKVVEPLGESVSDQELILKFAQSMGLSEYFPWKDVRDSIDEELKRLNLTYHELEEEGIHLIRYSDEDVYNNYERTGFKTPSGRVEFFSSTYLSYGYDPLPDFKEPAESPKSTPDLFKQYPLICGAGTKRTFRTHTQFYMLSWLNEIDPEPFVEINPETAKALAIDNGEHVIIESPRATIRIKAKITKASPPGVVFITPGWGQPYTAWKGMIVNLLTDDSNRCPISSATGVRSFLCRVRKVK